VSVESQVIGLVAVTTIARSAAHRLVCGVEAQLCCNPSDSIRNNSDSCSALVLHPAKPANPPWVASRWLMDVVVKAAIQLGHKHNPRRKVSFKSAIGYLI